MFPQTTPSSVSEQAAWPARGTPQSVLVVDRDPDIRAAIADTLAEAGYSVHQASCCDAAVAFFMRHGAVDVLLVEAQLTEMSGPELAAVMAQDFPTLRPIYMIGKHDKQNCSPSVRKPFTLPAFQMVVAETTDM